MVTSVVYHANFRDVANKFSNQIDLIYTDPPYKRKDDAPHHFASLAFWGPQLLKDGGSLLTLTPHYLLEDVMALFNGHFAERLKFRWIYCQNQEQGPHPRMAMGIEVMWKPILHYVKRAFPQGRGFVKDMIHIPEPQKEMHPWQQSEEWAKYYVPKFTDEGDTVLDPFMGTGTAAIVALESGRNFIGIENNHNTIEEARDRIWQELSITTTVLGASTAILGRTGQNGNEESTNDAP
jgi:site-specific DNA-methyltransferase (adenine-specific)